ncbi:MAG: SDR family oxidoreductase [Egibacteraceae bacterium]
MDIVIAGAHGKIARHLNRRLALVGHATRGIVRDAAHAADLDDDGVTPVVLDLEEASVDRVAEAIAGADAVVFTAGAGPGSGAARKETVDYGAAVRLRAAAEEAGVPRYVMVSAMGVDDPPQDDEVFSVYLRAKQRADADLMASDLDWTILRPGGLTDEPGTGRIEVGPSVPRGRIPREDVAALLHAVLDDPETAGVCVEVVSGPTPIDEAVASLRP